MRQSLTISGLVIITLSYFIEPSEADTVVNGVVAAVDALAPVVGIALTYWGRYRQGNITWYGKKL